MSELWKDIPGWEGYYQVSNRARIRSLARTVPTYDNSCRTVHPHVMRVSVMRRNAYYTTMIRLCKQGKYTALNVVNLMRDVWGTSWSHDAVILANEDTPRFSVPVISESPQCFFPSFRMAGDYFGMSGSAVRKAVVDKRPLQTASGPVILRTLTDEEKDYYKEFMVAQKAIV